MCVTHSYCKLISRVLRTQFATTFFMLLCWFAKTVRHKPQAKKPNQCHDHMTGIFWPRAGYGYLQTNASHIIYIAYIKISISSSDQHFVVVVGVVCRMRLLESLKPDRIRSCIIPPRWLAPKYICMFMCSRFLCFVFSISIYGI